MRKLNILAATALAHDSVARVSCQQTLVYPADTEKFHIVAIDCGIKMNIIRSLNARGCKVTCVPWNTPAEVIETLPSTGGEDFAAYQKEIPGVFAFVGSNGEENAPDWHHDDFLVKDEALPVAVNYYVENALFLLDYFKEQ